MCQLHKTDQYISPVLCLVRKLRHGQEGEGHDLLWRGWVQTGILTSALAQEGARTDWNPRGWPGWAANRVTWGMRRMHCSNRVWGEPHLHIYPNIPSSSHSNTSSKLPNNPQQILLENCSLFLSVGMVNAMVLHVQTRAHQCLWMVMVLKCFT